VDGSNGWFSGSGIEPLACLPDPIETGMWIFGAKIREFLFQFRVHN